MRTLTICTFWLLAILAGCTSNAKSPSASDTDTCSFSPGEVWLDTNGDTIQAHGAGILFYNDTYYLYGEYKKGQTLFVKDPNWDSYIKRVDVIGISCYSSKDLCNWKFEGIVLPAVRNDSTSDIHTSKVLERPKVIYNDVTKKFVMWMHVDTWDYQYARAGIAVSDSPTGPFSYQGSLRPNDQMSRDMTLFKDDDGRAYHIYSSENNATMHISLLTADYLRPAGRYTRNFINQEREAPAVFKNNGKYYIVTSGCTGWNPNPAGYAVADSMLGNWTWKGDPCINDSSKTTFGAQSTFVVKVAGKENSYIFVADRWKPDNLRDSRYVWLPLKVNNDKLEISWLKQWKISDIENNGKAH